MTQSTFTRIELLDIPAIYIYVPRFRKRYKLKPYDLRALCFLYRCHRQGTEVYTKVLNLFLFKMGNFTQAKRVKSGLPERGWVTVETFPSTHGRAKRVYSLTPEGLALMEELGDILSASANNIREWGLNSKRLKH